MKRLTFTRDFYYPKGAVKIADKASDAVAYVYNSRRPGAVIFFGKGNKPVSNYTYTTEAAREAAVKRAFEGRRARAAMMAGRAAERKAFVPTYKVGDIFRTSWGYDQTNVEFYEIVGLSGKIATVREIGAESIEDGFMSGTAIPLPGSYAGEAKRVRMTEGGFKVDGHYASYMPGTLVAGVKVYSPARWSSYA